MKPTLVGIGEILWDIFPSQNESANKTFGGATTNFTYHAHALGAHGIPVSCIGSVLFAADSISNHTGYKTNVQDTVGAGDAFIAALALGILQGNDLETINDYANRVASFVCSCPGATPKMPAHLRINGK